MLTVSLFVWFVDTVVTSEEVNVMLPLDAVSRMNVRFVLWIIPKCFSDTSFLSTQSAFPLPLIQLWVTVWPRSKKGNWWHVWGIRSPRVNAWLWAAVFYYFVICICFVVCITAQHLVFSDSLILFFPIFSLCLLQHWWVPCPWGWSSSALPSSPSSPTCSAAESPQSVALLLAWLAW